MPVAPPCRTCGAAKAATPPDGGLPKWVRVWGFEGCVEWLPAPASTTALLCTTPAEGGLHRLRVQFPFSASIAATFWTLYQPVLSCLNGWSEHPDELASSALALCRLQQDLGGGGGQQEVEVVVLRSLRLDEVPAFFLQATDGPLPQLSTNHGSFSVVRYQNLVCHEWSVQSDFGGWELYQRHKGAWVATVYGVWGGHDSHIFAGHRKLTGTEARARELD